MSTRTTAPSKKQGSSSLPALGLLTLELFGFFYAASAPSPLFVIFQDHWGLQPLALTIVFAVYAVMLLVALLFAGGISDHIGRKPAIMIALAVQVLAMLIFLIAGDVVLLVAARAVQGFATGIATGALSAAIIEAAPDGHKRIGALINGSAPLAGLAAGALSSGFISQLTAEPVLLTFGSLAVFFAVTGVLTGFIRETASRRPGILRSLVPRVSIPRRARAEFLISLPAVISVWALGGLYLALIPSTISESFHLHNGLVNGLAIATLNAVGAGTPILLRRWPGRWVALFGTTMLFVGVAVVLLGIAASMLPVFFIGTAVAGAGFGAAFSGSLQLMGPLADPHQRAELFAAIYVASYLAFSIPAIAAGLVVSTLGLHTTDLIYGTMLILVALTGTVARILATRRSGT